ncbi:uncharacterized protein METZ01_LOCUS308556, partial [marine metagenome]
MNGFAIIILVALLGEYILSIVSCTLNLRALSPTLPPEFTGVFDREKYARSQAYTRTHTQFGLVRSTVNLTLILMWWQVGGFEWLDQLLRGFSDSPLVRGLLYIGSLVIASSLCSLPFRLYSTFVIEQRYGFNRTTAVTFAADLLKGLLLSCVLGGILLTAILLFFEWTGPLAWLWCWLVATI